MNDVGTIISRDLSPARRSEVVRFSASAVRLDADKIGWLPYCFYESCDASGHLVAVARNGDLVGFCTFRPPNVGHESKIIQCWVRKDARQIEHGRALVARVDRIAGEEGAAWLSCWVAADLEAMRFWPAIGFSRVQARVGRGAVCEFSSRRMLHQFVRRVWSLDQTIPPAGLSPLRPYDPTQ